MVKLKPGATSHELLMIVNLRNTAIHHKKNCNDNCDVSVTLLRDAAKFIKSTIYDEKEWEQADKLVNEMPIV